MANQFSEDLFKSIDTIISARTRQLPYDQTLIGFISDVSERDKGIYKAKYESLELIAYSENTEYELGDQVYISIPQSDFNQKKIILGRIPQDDTEVIKIRPFENYIPCTENFNKRDREYSIVINGQSNRILVASYNFFANKDYAENAGYDLLGLKLNLSVNATNNNFIPVAGDYYISVIVNAFDQSKSLESIDAVISNKTEQIEFKITTDDMVIIDKYNSYGYCSQEKTFNIKDYVIRDIQVYLVQDGKFLAGESEELIPAEQNLTISCKDINLTFGYAGRKQDFYREKLYIYTPDGLLYNSNDVVKKQMYSRVVGVKDEKIYNYQPPNSYKFVQWYKYNSNSSEYIDILGVMSYSLLKDIVSYAPILDFAGGAAQQHQRYRMAVSKDGYDWITSDSIVFTNNLNLTNSEILDSLTGFQVSSVRSGESDEYRDGIFNIYGQDNLLLNDVESFKTQYLRVSYSATASDRKLRKGDILKWKIPKTNTMLLPALDEDGEEITSIILQGDKIDLDEEGYYWLPFRIKNLYNPIYTQNTISCELTLVEENGINTVLNCDKELFFGTSGSSGNDYLLTLELCKNNLQKEKISAIFSTDDEEFCKDNYIIIPKLYSYTMEEIELLPADISYSWLESPNSTSQNPFDGFDKIKPEKRILKAYISNYQVTAYLPIATKLSTAHSYIEGCKTITYDITGKKPVYYKFKNKLITSQTGFDPVLELCYEDQEGNWIDTSTKNGLPKLEEDIVVPPSIYSNEINNICLNFYLEDKINNKITLAWVQPILITKNKYPSAMLNEEMNQTKIGDYVIQQTMVGQVDKDKGLLIGQINDRFGLIGLNNNKPFFSVFLDDGEIYGQGFVTKSSLLCGDATEQKPYNIGNNTVPVYFKDGIPVAIPKNIATDYDLNGNIKEKFDSIEESLRSLVQENERLRAEINELKEQIQNG